MKQQDLKGYTIAVDFDGTITMGSNYPDIGEMRPLINVCIEQLWNRGAEIIIWTCRHDHGTPETHAAYQAMIDFLKEHDIKHDAINKNLVELAPNPGPKIYADLYLDDKTLCWNPECNGHQLYGKIDEYFKKNPKSIKETYHLEGGTKI